MNLVFTESVTFELNPGTTVEVFGEDGSKLLVNCHRFIIHPPKNETVSQVTSMKEEAYEFNSLNQEQNNDCSSDDSIKEDHPELQHKDETISNYSERHSSANGDDENYQSQDVTSKVDDDDNDDYDDSNNITNENDNNDDEQNDDETSSQSFHNNRFFDLKKTKQNEMSYVRQEFATKTYSTRFILVSQIPCNTTAEAIYKTFNLSLRSNLPKDEHGNIIFENTVVDKIIWLSSTQNEETALVLINKEFIIEVLALMRIQNGFYRKMFVFSDKDHPGQKTYLRLSEIKPFVSKNSNFDPMTISFYSSNAHHQLNAIKETVNELLNEMMIPQSLYSITTHIGKFPSKWVHVRFTNVERAAEFLFVAKKYDNLSKYKIGNALK